MLRELGRDRRQRPSFGRRRSNSDSQEISMSEPQRQGAVPSRSDHRQLDQTASPKENRMNRLKGKVAVVTGASKGIGASIAEHLAAEGASVVVNYAASKAGADAVMKRINDKGGKAVAVQADVSKPEDVKRLFAQAKAAYGKLDVV